MPTSEKSRESNRATSLRNIEIITPGELVLTGLLLQGEDQVPDPIIGC